jgi:hypothetical protein
LRRKGGILGLVVVVGKGDHLCRVQVGEKVDTRQVEEEEEESLVGWLCIVVICLLMM